MSATPIMVFNITIDRSQISRMECPTGKITIIPFGGTVESELFSGSVLPGAADIQVTNAAGIRHMCAKYMFKGKDSAGNDCCLFVENNGFFEPNSTPRPFHACPKFMTDSPVLAPYLHNAQFRAEGLGNDRGVDISIYDVTRE